MGDVWWRPWSVLAVVVLAVVGFQGVNAHRARAGGSEKRPLTAAWTPNGSYPWRGTMQTTGTQQASDITSTFDWAPGVFVGQSVAKMHVVMNHDGTGTGTGFEMFVGSVEGRPGQIVFSNDATFTNVTDYQGAVVCVGGTGALRGIRCLATYVGKAGVGGHTTGGWYAFDD